MSELLGGVWHDAPSEARVSQNLVVKGELDFWFGCDCCAVGQLEPAAPDDPPDLLKGREVQLVWEVDALFRPETRAAYRRLLAQGWTDALRHLNPGEPVFTFWDYTAGAWRRNAGLRIDHLLLNPAAARRLAAAGVDRDVRGWEKTSDHAPTWVELRDA